VARLVTLPSRGVKVQLPAGREAVRVAGKSPLAPLL
jgi:hypothetical protein